MHLNERLWPSKLGHIQKTPGRASRCPTHPERCIQHFASLSLSGFTFVAPRREGQVRKTAALRGSAGTAQLLALHACVTAVVLRDGGGSSFIGL